MKSKSFWNFQDSADSERAELYIYGPIVSQSRWWDDTIDAKNFADDLQALQGRDITVRINSPGGDVFAAHAIHNQLIAYPGAVDVVIDGIAASAATIIAMAGGRITMPTNSMMMIHNPAVGLEDTYTAEELDHYANALRAVRKSIVAAYMKRASVGQAKIESMMDNETWLTAEECLSMGLADAIDGSIPSMLDGDELIVNSLRVDTTNYKNKKGLAHCVNKPASKHKEAGTLTKLEEILNALGLRIDDTDRYQLVDPKEVELNNTKPASAPVDADKVAADAVAAERQRVAALDAMADGNPTVAAIIDTAKRNGQTAEEVQCYVDAVKGIKNAAQTQLQNMQADAVMGGADSIAPGNVSDKANDDIIMGAIANAMGVKGGK
ncbi:head maturation protease, ClpP-related [Megasphaera elsdenii]|uniref:head maturation protease, ClpP-related n=1 Tax=Megasphaera elsdenii TaxID=907 RepID=UPI0009122909|nr:head maturation protease, ClpP-related [Megasphaera elsdenii]SHK45395.1 ATP-dependent protease ClpP, protease subunit [Megasphaera elsdenii]